MALSDPLRNALENLHRKKAGLEVDWINIADARELTELGLAQRSHQGWTITQAGQDAHGAQPHGYGDDDGETSGQVVVYP